MRMFARRRPAVAAAAVVIVLLALAAALGGCAGSGGSGADTASPAATASPGGPSPIPSALTETYTSETYGFSFEYPSGFEVQVEPDFIESQTDVFDLALLPTTATADAFGFAEGNSVRLVAMVNEKTQSWLDVDSDGVAQQMIVSIQDHLASLDDLDSTGVEPTDIDGFAAAQVAYSYDTEAGREDTWLLQLIEPDGDYRLEVQATSPAEVADRLEPVWTEVINSFTTL